MSSSHNFLSYMESWLPDRDLVSGAANLVEFMNTCVVHGAPVRCVRGYCLYCNYRVECGAALSRTESSIKDRAQSPVSAFRYWRYRSQLPRSAEHASAPTCFEFTSVFVSAFAIGRLHWRCFATLSLLSLARVAWAQAQAGRQGGTAVAWRPSHIHARLGWRTKLKVQPLGDGDGGEVSVDKKRRAR